MSGTKVKTLYKNLKTQDESSLETFQELPITFRDASSTSPVPLDIYVSEDKASIKLPGSSGSESSATINNNGAPVPDSTTRILLSSDPNAPLAAIKAATATNSAYVSVDSDPALGGVQSTVASWGSSGKSAVSVAGSDISITASTSSVGQQTRVLLEGADNKVSVSGSLHVNVEDHGSPIDVFSVNSETSAGTLTAMISATANAFGVGASSTSISSDLVSINGPATTITGDVTINAQNQVKIVLENDGAEEEAFKLDLAGNSPRSIIAVHTDGGGSDISTLTLDPNQLRLYGDSLVDVNTTANGSIARLVAGGTGSQSNIEGDFVTLLSRSGPLSIQARNPESLRHAFLGLDVGNINQNSTSTITVDSDLFLVEGSVLINNPNNSAQDFKLNNVNLKIGDADDASENSEVYLYKLPLGSSDFIAQRTVGISPTTSRLYYSTADTFFSGGHVYHSEDQILPGTAVTLVSGSVVPTSSANSTVTVGIVARQVSHTEFSEDTSSLGSAIDSGYATKVIALGDTRLMDCQGFNICNEGGAVQPGDLLVTSNTPGYLMRQIDDVIRSSTVGKAMESVVFDENGQATGVYGYLYCG